MLAETDCHQCSGSCSDQSGRGVESGCDTVALPATTPSPFMRSAFDAVVETSIPRNKFMYDSSHAEQYVNCQLIETFIPQAG